MARATPCSTATSLKDGLGVDVGKAHERDRGPQDDARRTANRYLKRIYYGNRKPLLDGAGSCPRFLDEAQIETQIADAEWMFEMVFDYGEHHEAVPESGGLGQWAHRPDPFSSYRSGFEVRTTRLCKRVLMFHHFPGEPGVERDCPVRSTN
jgi:Salmonella virulence plasmid 65kDa B protein